jgi:hypothetical protein
MPIGFKTFKQFVSGIIRHKPVRGIRAHVDWGFIIFKSDPFRDIEAQIFLQKCERE